MTLENWTIEQFYDNSFFIVGTIFGDEKKRFSDGCRIQTSRLSEINFSKKTATTKNSVYKLGSYGYDMASMEINEK